MAELLMPKASAIWLIDNTGLTFKQIARFCNLHELEVQGIADGEIARNITPADPIASGQLTRDEITACEKNPNRDLELADEMKHYLKQENRRTKSASYIPVARRQDKPNAIAWLLKSCPELTHANIAKLIGSTKKTIESIEQKTHWNIQSIKPQDPVLLGLCLQSTLDAMYKVAKEKFEQQNTAASKMNQSDLHAPPSSEMSILEGFADLGMAKEHSKVHEENESEASDSDDRNSATADVFDNISESEEDLKKDE